MASSLLTLLDDIATILDDMAVMTKVAAKKTAGVLGDDLALNAEQVSGVRADRELPVVWAVAKGSVRNKLILVPAALAISALLPWAVTPLMMVGGLFLCYEGFEKIASRRCHVPENVGGRCHSLGGELERSAGIASNRPAARYRQRMPDRLESTTSPALTLLPACASLRGDCQTGTAANGPMRKEDPVRSDREFIVGPSSARHPVA